MEHLSDVAQDEARAQAERWCEQQLDAVRGAIEGPLALGGLLAGVIDDWCETQRTLAFAWRESQLMALRDIRHCPTRMQWSVIWQDFWAEICGRLGIADMAPATAWLFEGIAALHMVRWRRLLDRAALDEQCRGWASWLDGRLAGPSPWFDLARSEALLATQTQPPVLDDPVVARITAAAARIVEKRGVSGLTHRAVAAEAEVTLGIVSYKFRTSADLLHAAFEAIYLRLVPRIEDATYVAPALGREDGLQSLESGYAAREDVLGMEELFVASSRDAALGGANGQLRYLRGRSSGPYLQALVGSEQRVSPLDAAIFSAFLTGRGNTYLHGDRTPTREDVTPLLARLSR